MSNSDRALLVLKYSLYSFGILLLFSFLGPFLGLGIGIIQNLVFIIIGAEIVLCCNEYKRKAETILDYKSAFAIGWQLTFITGLINGIVVLLAVKILGEENFLSEVSKYKNVMMSQGVTDEAAIDKLIKLIANPWNLLLITLVFYLIIGFFLSSVIAFFVKTSATSTHNEE